MSMTKRFVFAAALVGLMVGASGQARAEVNYDPLGNPPPPVLNAGWSYDQINTTTSPSSDSPYVGVLASPAIFSITDQFVAGDIYTVYNFGSLILTSSFNGPQAPFAVVGDPTGEAGWESGAYSHGQVLLGAGAYDLTVYGNGAGGLPAGYYDRLDSVAVPEPSTLVLAGLGVVAGIAYSLARRRKVQPEA